MTDVVLDPEQHKQRVKKLLGAIDYYRSVRLDADKQEKTLKKKLTELNKQFAGMNDDDEGELPFDGEEDEMQEEQQPVRRLVGKGKQQQPKAKKAKRLNEARKSAVRPKNQRSVRDYIAEEAVEEPEEEEEEEEYEEGDYDEAEEAEEGEEEGEEGVHEQVVEQPPAPKPKPPTSAPPCYPASAHVLVKKPGKGIQRQKSLF